MGCLLNCLKLITVEPIAMIFWWTIPYIDHGNGVLLFNYFCHLEHNETFCDIISKPEHANSSANHEIQGHVSIWIMYSKIAMVVPMLYSTTILGAISDNLQRKLPLMLPAIGVTLGTLWLLGLSLVPGVIVTRYFLVSSFLFGITGYYGALLMSTSAYLGDVTSSESRTWRITVYEFVMSLGTFLGTVSSGLIIDNLGVSAVYAIAASLSFATVLYTMIRVEETHKMKPNRPVWKEMCEFSHVREYVRTVYKPREQSRKLYIHIIFGIFMFGTCAGQGLYDVLFLYLTKSRDFTNTEFSHFTGSQSITTAIGGLIFMYVLQSKLRFTEPALNVISAAGTAIAYSMISSKDSRVIWMSTMFMVVHMLGGSSARGFLSKLVPKEEQGQVFAFIGMGQCMTGLIASVIFNGIYPTSLRVWDGLCPFLSGMLNVIGVSLGLFVYIHRRVNNHTDEAMNLLPDKSKATNEQTHSLLQNEEGGSEEEEEVIFTNPNHALANRTTDEEEDGLAMTVPN